MCARAAHDVNASFASLQRFDRWSEVSGGQSPHALALPGSGRRDDLIEGISKVCQVVLGGSRRTARRPATAPAQRRLAQRLLDRPSGHPLRTLEVVATFTVLGIGARAMYNMVLCTLDRFLPVDSDRTVAVCAAHIGLVPRRQVRDRNFDPARFLLAFHFVKPLDGTPGHHVTRHRVLSPFD